MEYVVDDRLQTGIHTGLILEISSFSPIPMCAHDGGTGERFSPFRPPVITEVYLSLPYFSHTATQLVFSTAPTLLCCTGAVP